MPASTTSKTSKSSSHGTSLPPPAPAKLPGPTPDVSLVCRFTWADPANAIWISASHRPTWKLAHDIGVIDMEVFGQLLEVRLIPTPSASWPLKLPSSDG